MSTRRDFLGNSAGSALAVAALASGAAVAADKTRKSAQRKFQLKYGPHFGMFKAHAGEDLIAQIEFMADQGFTAFEDNGLMGRAVDVQQKIGAAVPSIFKSRRCLGTWPCATRSCPSPDATPPVSPRSRSPGQRPSPASRQPSSAPAIPTMSTAGSMPQRSSSAPATSLKSAVPWRRSSLPVARRPCRS